MATTTAPAEPSTEPRRGLTVFDASAIIVGVVVGAGIFRLPGTAALFAGNELNFMLLWVMGGVISLIGAFCYAELATTYPSAGGDYHFLTRAFGLNISFLFGWARMTIIQTGSIALQAYIIGDYMSTVLPLGAYSPSIYAALTVVILTLINTFGISPGKWTQNVLTVATVLALISVAIAGLALVTPPPAAPVAPPVTGEGGPGVALGLAMVFVLLTYGGWNEAAYLSAEVKNGRRAMAKAMFMGIGAVTAVYLLANFAFTRGLGFEALQGAEVPAADLLRMTRFGEDGARFVSLLITIAALSTTNATIITGARTNYALGKDFPALAFLGRWQAKGSTPVNALLLQGAISLALVALAARIEASGVDTMVAYTSPIFWLFFMLVGFSVFILRRWEPDVERPFRVPLYPVTPLIFCAVCAYMLHSSLGYAGNLDIRIGMITIAVLALGVLLLLLVRPNGHVKKQHNL
jgi:basic amino acid/polyamine antiporter, APA family